MEQEISPANIPEPASKTIDFLAIKGGLTEAQPITKLPIHFQLNKFLGNHEAETYSLRLPLENFMYRIAKRAGDLIFSTLVIAGILSWLIPLIALAIKIDSKGPVFFLQKRNKRNGGIFTCIKFRSMIMNDEADITQARINDLRITRLGKFLRNHYLDELPQFFNIWWGDMSLIGPRPHMVNDNLKYEELIEFYDYRHRVKPGITGLAQVLGYVGETKYLQRMKDRVLLDIFYIRHWSIALDLKIFFRTFFRVIRF